MGHVVFRERIAVNRDCELNVISFFLFFQTIGLYGKSGYISAFVYNTKVGLFFFKKKRVLQLCVGLDFYSTCCRGIFDSQATQTDTLASGLTNHN